MLSDSKKEQPVIEMSFHERFVLKLLKTASEKALLEISASLGDSFVDLEGQSPGSSLVYISGGWVRDKILQKDSKDIDCIVAHGAIGPLMAGFEREFNKAQTSLQKSDQKGTFQRNDVPLSTGQCKNDQLTQIEITILTQDTAEEPSEIIEKLSFDFREVKPEHKTVKNDLKTRDFSVNGLYYDIRLNKVVDYCRGVEDCSEGLLRAINSFESTFSDKTRFLRAFRFEITKGLRMEPELREYWNKHAQRGMATIEPKELHALAKEVRKLRKHKNFPEIFGEMMRRKIIIGQEEMSESTIKTNISTLKGLQSFIESLQISNNPNAGDRYNQEQVEVLVVALCCVRKAEKAGNIWKEGPSIGNFKQGLKTVFKFVVTII